MRHLIALLALCTAFTARAEVVDVDNAELARLLAAKVPLIDIRTQPEWLDTGIVPGSHLLTFFDERGQANPRAWLDKAQAIAKPATPVIVICRTGNRTKAVSQFLSNQVGYAKVYNVKHGIRGWIQTGGNVAPAAPTLTACRIAGNC